MHYVETIDLHEQDAQETIIYCRQADNFAANKVSVAIFIDRLTCFSTALSSAEQRFAESTQNREEVR